MIKISKDEEEETIKYIIKGINIFKKIKFKAEIPTGYVFLGEAYTNMGVKNEAFIYLNKALSMCHEMGIEYWPDKIQEILDRL